MVADKLKGGEALQLILIWGWMGVCVWGGWGWGWVCVWGGGVCVTLCISCTCIQLSLGYPNPGYPNPRLSEC